MLQIYAIGSGGADLRIHNLCAYENYDLGLGVGAINNKKIDISVSPALTCGN